MGTTDAQRQTIEHSIYSTCQEIGGGTLDGGFDGEGYHFKYTCDCARDDTGVFVARGIFWSAQGSRGSKC